MEQTPATTAHAAATAPASTSNSSESGDHQRTPGFASRGRLRRRARFLRKARELAYRDLGGLVFSLHRFGQRNDALVLAKLDTLGQIDAELRALEGSLQERRPVTVLREAGITACPRCAAIHGSEDRFCPSCGLPISRHVDLPIAGPAASSRARPASPATAARSADLPHAQTTPTGAPVPAPNRGPAPQAPTPPARPGAAAPSGTPGAAEATSAGADSTGVPDALPAGASAPASAPADRSPKPRRAPASPRPAPAARAEDEEPTEIVRPRPDEA